MLVISNHVKTIGMDYPKDAVIRINLAWIKSWDDVENILGNTEGHKIWLDYPTGRRKPPTPSMSLLEALELCKTYSNHISHFAFSNAEDKNLIELIRFIAPATVKLVPKIETKIGVSNIEQIVKAAKTDIIMLDKEDLYVDCDADPVEFNNLVTIVKDWCSKHKATCLELKGVIFGD